jgi:hypothetical protein
MHGLRRRWLRHLRQVREAGCALRLRLRRRLVRLVRLVWLRLRRLRRQRVMRLLLLLLLLLLLSLPLLRLRGTGKLNLLTLWPAGRGWAPRVILQQHPDGVPVHLKGCRQAAQMRVHAGGLHPQHNVLHVPDRGERACLGLKRPQPLAHDARFLPCHVVIIPGDDVTGACQQSGSQPPPGKRWRQLHDKQPHRTHRQELVLHGRRHMQPATSPQHSLPSTIPNAALNA